MIFSVGSILLSKYRESSQLFRLTCHIAPLAYCSYRACTFSYHPYINFSKHSLFKSKNLAHSTLLRTGFGGWVMKNKIFNSSSSLFLVPYLVFVKNRPYKSRQFSGYCHRCFAWHFSVINKMSITFSQSLSCPVGNIYYPLRLIVSSHSSASWFLPIIV